MRLSYKFDIEKINLQQSPNGEDVEFLLHLLDPKLKMHLVNIRDYFNANKITTDILVYTHPDNKYQIIVRKDFYVDFLLQLFKQKLLTELKWG